MKEGINFEPSLGDLVDGMRHIFHVTRSKGHHGDTSICGHEHSILRLQLGHLLRIHARVAKHSNLFRDVRPIASRACMSERHLICNMYNLGPQPTTFMGPRGPTSAILPQHHTFLHVKQQVVFTRWPPYMYILLLKFVATQVHKYERRCGSAII